MTKGPATAELVERALSGQRAAFVERHRAELEAIFEERAPKVQAIHRKVREEIAAVLTPEQRQRMKELDAHRPPHRFGGPPGFGPPPPGMPPPPFPHPPPDELH